MIPPTRYIDAGPGVPFADPSAAMAQGKAYAMLGNTISAIGEKGMQMAGKIREIDETTKLSEFYQQAEMKAAEFSDSLMTRHDSEKWPDDWKRINSEQKAALRNLGLSPEAFAKAEADFGQWSTRRAIRFETQAASKTIETGRTRSLSAADYHFKRGDIEQGVKSLRDAGEVGLLSPVELEEGIRRGEEIAAVTALDEDIRSNPQATLARLESGEFLSNTPGADLQLVERGKRQAHAQIQEFRSGEMDKLETAAMQGTLKGRDIEAAQFVTDKDRAALVGALAMSDPPSNEEHAKAWEILSNLREARNDPATSPERFREVWNEARGAVLQTIPPQWQGDVKKELSYLSPAGRAPDGTGLSGGYTMADLEAVGRDIAFRARAAGFFGTIAEDAPPAVREKAFRKADDVRLEVKRWIGMQKETNPEQVREYTDSLISGDRIKSTARELQSFVPGTGQRFRSARAMPTLPPKQGAKDKANPDPLDISPGDGDSSDALLPARQQLETFIK